MPAFETTLTDELKKLYEGEGYWTGRTITDYLDEAAASKPDKVAVVDRRGRLTYGELKRLVDRCALGFLESGVRPNDVISFQLPNWREWTVVHLAATRIGTVSNPLIPIYREREVRFMMGLGEAKLLVIPRHFRNFDYARMVERLRPDLPDLEQILVMGDAPEGMGSWEEFIDTPWEERRSPDELAGLRPAPNDVTLLIFTSGTTGEPKGVMHTHNTLCAALDPVIDRLGLSEETVFHIASTLAHLTGCLYGARLPIQLGAAGVYQDVWDAERFVELIEEHRINATMGATPFLHDLLNARNLADHDVSSLERFGCTGAPIPRAMLREAREKLPRLAVVGSWGQTEAAMVTLGKPDDPEEKIMSTDGCPLPGMSVRLVDADGAELPRGQEGLVQVRGPFLFVGYARRLEMTRGEYDGGWFDTSDLATLDDDGYISITGRAKDTIIRGGENIPVSYVENALYENPMVEDVTIVSMPDPRLQERACAFVVPREGQTMTFEQMQRFLEEKGVAKQYWPERLEVVSEFPRTPSGKIQKFVLRDRIREEASTED